MLEKDKIIEVLLSQERVLTLLYDRTFPPRANTQPPPANQDTLSQNGSMRKYNYQGTKSNFNEPVHYDAEDLATLEKEVEQVIRCGTA